MCLWVTPFPQHRRVLLNLYMNKLTHQAVPPKMGVTPKDSPSVHSWNYQEFRNIGVQSQNPLLILPNSQPIEWPGSPQLHGDMNQVIRLNPEEHFNSMPIGIH